MRRSTWPSDAQVVVAEHAPAGHVAGLRLAHHRLARPLGDLPAELRVHLRAHDARDVGREVPIFEPRAVLVEPDVDPGLGDALQLAERLIAVAPAKARGVPQDEHPEGRTGVDGIQESLPVDEPLNLRATHRVVGVDVRVGNGPALRSREGTGVLDLALDTRGVGVGAGLLGALATVDGGDHGVPLFAAAMSRSHQFGRAPS